MRLQFVQRALDFPALVIQRGHLLGWRRLRVQQVVQDAAQTFRENGPWRYRRSEINDTPEVAAAVERLRAVRDHLVA